MGLIKCSECGKKFSDKALACPECSCPTSVVINCQEKSFYIELLKEKADSLNNLNDEKEKEIILCECICLLLKIKDEKEEINFNSSFDVKKSVLKKIDNIDMNSITELGISNDKEIIDFISKRLLISELINIQKKYEDEIAEKRKHYCGLSNHEIEESIETEVEYYYRNRQNSKNGVFYKKFTSVTSMKKELSLTTHLYSLCEKGIAVRETTTLLEKIFIYDKKLIEDCKIANSICRMYINQYILRFSLYCFLKEKKKVSFKEISDFIEKELKYIIPEAKKNEIKSYINILFIFIKCYYKIDENDKIALYEEDDNNEKEYLHWCEFYEKCFRFISQYLSKNNVLNLNREEYDKIKIEYKKELDGIDYPRLLLLCRILTCNDILKSDETYYVFENNMQLYTNLKDNINSLISKKEDISLNDLEKEIYKKMQLEPHLNLYLSKQIRESLLELESEQLLTTFEKNEECFISVYSETMEKEKKIKKQEEQKRIQTEQEEMKKFFTAPNVLCKKISLFKLLLSKKELYLGYFNESDDYNELSKLFTKLANNYNEYALAVLNVPLQQYKPMSSSTAGTLGTIAGGLSAGILASERAEKKMAEYKESQNHYYSSKSKMDIARKNAEESYYMIEKIIFKNIETRNDWIQTRGEHLRDSKNNKNLSGGCYVATCVYGSYDCPQVWTLRRYRDNVLAKTWYGRLFIKIYYSISPTIVKLFGETKCFKKFCKGKLDKMIMKLQNEGYESTPYQDINWR